MNSNNNNQKDGSIWEEELQSQGAATSTGPAPESDDLEEKILRQTRFEEEHPALEEQAWNREDRPADNRRTAGGGRNTEANYNHSSIEGYGRQADYGRQSDDGNQAGYDSREDYHRQADRLAQERARLEKERKLLEKERKRTAAASKKAAKARKQYEKTARGERQTYAGGRYDPYAGDPDLQEQDYRQYSDRKRGRRQSRGQYEDDAPGRALYDPYSGQKVRPKKKKHKARRFFLTILLLLILGVALWIFIQVRTMQSMGMDSDQIQNSIADSVKKSIASGGAQGDYKNVAILGVDSIDNSLDSGNNRSDVMIIASINNKTGAIRLMSVYRDTYLDIGDGNYQKANAAYAYGGPDQTVQMLNRNLDLDITDYGVVGFEGIARLIDAMGGVEIDVQEDEIVHLNNYQLTMSEETGLTNIPVTHAGPQTLNGLQATAYCRIRYTDGNDFRRTERQRTVLTKTFDKIKSNPLRLVANLNAILPYVKTSLSVPEMFTLGASALRFNVEAQEGFPSQDLLTVGYINKQSCVIPITLSKNVSWLHSELFGESDYQPSQTVQDISAHISSVTGYY